jgi:hypothetical protein
VIYICLPAHDEQQTVGVVLWKIRQVMADFPRDFQILVVDDASTDATPDVLDPYTGVLPLTVLRNRERRGYAASLELLLREAVRRSTYPKRDSIVTLQADFTEEPEHIAALVKRIESGADVVSSSAAGGSTLGPREWRWARRLGRLALRGMRWPKDAGDPLSGLRAYRVFTIGAALDAVGQERLLRHEGWAANAELLHAALPHARRIETVELPFRYHRRQRASRFGGWATLREVLGYAFGRSRARPLAATGELEAALTAPRRRASVLTDQEALEDARTQRRENGSEKRGRNGRGRSGSGGRNGARPARGKRSGGNGGGEARGQSGAAGAAAATDKPKQGRRKGRAGRGATSGNGAATEEVRAEGGGTGDNGGEDAAKKKRRRRGRRGGRNRRRGGGVDKGGTAPDASPTEQDTPRAANG